MKKNKLLSKAFMIAFIVWAIMLIKQQINIVQYKNEMKELSSKIKIAEEELNQNKQDLEEEKQKLQELNREKENARTKISNLSQEKSNARNGFGEVQDTLSSVSMKRKRKYKNSGF